MIHVIEPKARVLFLLQDEDGVYRFYDQFQKFERITTNCSIEGGNTATILYVDPDHSRFSKRAGASTEGKVIEEIEYLGKLLQELKGYNGLNEEYWQYKYEHVRNILTVASYQDEVIKPMGLVWIDYSYYDEVTKREVWYAAFSGMISSVSRDVSRGATVSITINCMDCRRFLATIPAIIMWQVLPYLTESQNVENIPKFVRDYFSVNQGGVTHLLAGETVDRCIEKLLNMANVWFSSVAKKIDILTPGGVRESKAIKLWNKSSQDYIGLDHTRNVDWDIRSYENYLSTISDDTDYRYLGKSYVDANLRAPKTKTDNYAYAVQALLMSKMQLFSPQYENIEALFKRIFGIYFADWYVDVSGNMISALPRYNNLPSIDGTQWDMAEDESLMTKFHDERYILRDGRDSYSKVEAEDPVTNFVIVPGGYNYINGIDGKLIANYMAAYVWGEEKSFSKYGLRVKSVERMYFNKVLQMEAMKAYGKATMSVYNAQAITGGISLVHRPDLQMGRTIVLLEEELIAYITGIRSEFVPGERHTTGLQFSYGRRFGERIPNPWLELKNKLSAMSTDQAQSEIKTVNNPFTGNDDSYIAPPNKPPTAQVLQSLLNSSGPNIILNSFEPYENDYRIEQGLLDKFKSVIGDYIVDIKSAYRPFSVSSFVRENYHIALCILKVDGFSVSDLYNNISPGKEHIQEFLSALNSGGFDYITLPDELANKYVCMSPVDVADVVLTPDQLKYYRSVIFVGAPYS